MTTTSKRQRATFWRDRNDTIVIWQTPNVWLAGWIVLTLLSVILKPHHITQYASDGATVLLGVWAGLEIVSGVNYFRRLLGLVILVMIIATRV